MRIAVIGASGTIGSAIVAALQGKHEVLPVTHSTGPYRVDLADPASIAALYRALGPVDAVVSAAGNAAWKPLDQLTDADFAFSLGHKLMGQVHLIRQGLAAVKDGGSITVTTGIFATHPIPGTAAIALANAGIEGFVRAAALEAPRGIRVNAVRPGWVDTTLAQLGMDPKGGRPAAEIARAYVAVVEGGMMGESVVPG